MKIKPVSKPKKPGHALLKVEYRKLAALRPYANNPKIHQPAQIRALARGISAHGFVNPILVDPGNEIIAGHGRYEAAVSLGMTEVPVIVLGHLSEAQKRAYRIADNRLGEIASSWSFELLRIEADAILELDPSCDLSLTGFETSELNISFDTADSKAEAPDPEIPEVSAKAITRLGDVLQIGEHRVICGDATQAATYVQLLGRERPAMMIADPPYNVPIVGHVSGMGKVKHREFVAASGEMSDAQFQRFLLQFMTQCARYCKDGALHYVFMDWRGLSLLLAAGKIAYDEYKNLCVWVKSQGGMGSLYRSRHELVAVFKQGKAVSTNNVELGKHGRNRTNVWECGGMNSFSRERDELLALHPTVKPLALVRDAILDASNRDDFVLDPFGGSGTTLLAADAVRRRARLIELDPLYVDVIVRRAEKALGTTAMLVSTGQTFAEVAATREQANV